MEHNFTLTITGDEHGEWQGHVTREGSQPAAFQSVLELLKILKTETEKQA